MDEITTPQNLEQVNVTQPTRTNLLLIVTLIFFVLLVSVGSYMLGLNFQKKTSTPTKLPVQISTNPASPSPYPNTESYTESTSVPYQKKFVSPRLGISFLYMEKLADTDSNGNVINNPIIYQTKEIGNKVYLYSSNMSPEKGQWVEIFSKNSQKALRETIKQDFLKNFSENDCPITDDLASTDRFPPHFETAWITLRPGTPDDVDLMGNINLCPANYTALGGDRFFLEDKNHPDRYAFFSIGQYSIFATQPGLNPSVEDTTWQQTFSFL